MEDLNKIIQQYENRIENNKILKLYEENYLDKDHATKQSYQSQAYLDFYKVFTLSYCLKLDILTGKNALFNAARSCQITALHGKGLAFGVLNTIVQISAPLLSDYLPIIKDIPNWHGHSHEDCIKRGALVYVIKELLDGNQQEAEKLWDNGKSHQSKKKPFYLEERECVRCLLERDEQGLEQAVLQLMRPELHKILLDPVYPQHYFFSERAVAYLKLAYHLDMKVHVEHELIPKDLVLFAPIDNYHLLYKFMQREGWEVIQKEKW